MALTIPGGDTTDYIPMIVGTIQVERAHPNLHVILIDMGNNRGGFMHDSMRDQWEFLCMELMGLPYVTIVTAMA